MTLEALELADFTATIGETYLADTDGIGALPLVLVEATGHGDPRPFSVTFRGPADRPLQQGIVAITPPRGASRFPLFIVPVALDEDGYRYEAIFN